MLVYPNRLRGGRVTRGAPGDGGGGSNAILQRLRRLSAAGIVGMHATDKLGSRSDEGSLKDQEEGVSRLRQLPGL